MLYKISLLVAGFLAMNCQSQKNTKSQISPSASSTTKAATSSSSNASTAKATTITLREGENIFLKDQQMNVTFKNVSEDSRCPEGSNCVWAGAAVAEVEFMGTYTRPVTLKISTLNDAKKGYEKTLNFNGYNVSLVSLTPAPTQSKGLKQNAGSYKITLQIAPGETAGSSMTR